MPVERLGEFDQVGRSSSEALAQRSPLAIANPKVLSLFVSYSDLDSNGYPLCVEYKNGRRQNCGIGEPLAPAACTRILLLHWSDLLLRTCASLPPASLSAVRMQDASKLLCHILEERLHFLLQTSRVSIDMALDAVMNEPTL
jgi:hypothetical protein